MLAATRTQYGPPKLLSIQELETPVPGDKELLIRVHAATVNRTDCGILWAKPFIIRFFTGLVRPKQKSTGTDFAGVVEAVGKDVTLHKSGDRVFGFSDNNCGSHAQYLTLAEDGPLTTIPDHISFEEAAATPEGAHYAYNYIRKTKMKAGDAVMVYGATGAIGTAAIQILKHIGARVTAVANTKNLELVKYLGADRVIDYEKEDFTGDTETYDFIFDAVGKSSFDKCKKLLKPGGLYMATDLGPGNENIYLPLLTRWSKRRAVFPLPTDVKGSLAFLRGLLESGQFKPVIDRTYPLEQICEAFHYVISGQKTGNVVLKIS